MVMHHESLIGSGCERIVDATSHAASVRVIKEKRTAVCSTVDLTPKALSAMVEQALETLEHLLI